MARGAVPPSAASKEGMLVRVPVRGGAPDGPVANFFRPVCERLGKAGRLNFWLWIGLSDARISIHNCANTGSAERNSLKNRARKNFATGPFIEAGTSLEFDELAQLRPPLLGGKLALHFSSVPLPSARPNVRRRFAGRS